MNIIKGLPIFMMHDLKHNPISLQHQTDGELQHSKLTKIFLLNKIMLQGHDLFSSFGMWICRTVCCGFIILFLLLQSDPMGASTTFQAPVIIIFLVSASSVVTRDNRLVLLNSCNTNI